MNQRDAAGVRFHEILSEVARPFADGHVPSLPVAGVEYLRLIDGVRNAYPPLADVWSALKAGSTGYITTAAILSHPTFDPTRTAIGLLSSKAGDAARRQEWIFASTGPAAPVVYATLPDGMRETPLLKHTNALAALVVARGSTDFSPYLSARGKPRLHDHWPEWSSFAESDLRWFLERQDALARKLSK